MAWLAILLIGSSPANGLEEYVAVYEVKSMGFTAVSETSLKKVRDDAGSIVYEYRSTSKTRGLARLVRRAPVIETSRFRFDDDGFTPMEFHFINGKASDERSNHIIFADGKANSTYKGESVSMHTQAGYVDRALEQIVLRQGLQQGNWQQRFVVVDRNDVDDVVYSSGPTEDVETGLGKMTAVRLLRQKDGSSRSTRIWFAESLDFLPVRIEQLRKGEITAVATLVSYRLTD
jgi:hypothetical protein